MSNFMIRRLSQHSLHNSIQKQKDKQKPQNKLTIEPNKIIFQTTQSLNKAGIIKMKLKNCFNYAIQFQVKQPRQKYLTVKFSKNLLAPEQSIQLFVFYNKQAESLNANINDQFAIVVENVEIYALVIPIYLRNIQQIQRIKLKNKRQSKSKQNLKLAKLKNNSRQIGQKRYAGVILTTVKTKGEDNQFTTFYDRIQQFLSQFENIGNFLQTKAIKCEVFRGEKPITRQKYYSIISFNLTTQLMSKDIQKQIILKRYATNKSKSGPSIRNFQINKLQWNLQKNQPQITYKNALQKLFRQVRSFVIYHRFKKMNRILSIYRNLREQQNVEQPQTKIIINKFCLMNLHTTHKHKQFEFEADQNEEDMEYEKQIQEKKKHDYYCRKINKMLAHKQQKNLGADFALFTLTPRLLPIDIQQPTVKKNKLFQIKPRIGFDNWVTLQQSTAYHHELMGYHKIEGIHKWQSHSHYEFNKVHHLDETHQIQYSQNEENNEQNSEIYQNCHIILNISEKDHRQMRKELSFSQWDSQSKFKDIISGQNEINFLGISEQDIQKCIKKPIIPNSKCLIQMKIAKTEYIPYYEQPIKSLAYKLINQQHLPLLINCVNKQNLIIFNYIYNQQFSQKHIGQLAKSNKIGQKLNKEDDKNKQKDTQKQKQSKNTQMFSYNQHVNLIHERILENINKIKSKKYNLSINKISSFNKFAKKYQHKIFY